MSNFFGDSTPEFKRSINQNRALHLDCKMIAEKLNEAGVDIDDVLSRGSLNLSFTAKSVGALLGITVGEHNVRFLELIAKTLNESGYILNADISKHVFSSNPWDTLVVKELLWKPSQKAKYGKESTTELEKYSEEIETIHDDLMWWLGRMYGIEYHEFPHEEKLGSNQFN